MSMSSNEEKLAVLMPVFNGGERFIESLRSCAGAGLDASQYEILVVDNCSQDGVPQQLPARDENGACIQVHRNAGNLGRVGNWNRSVEIALNQGFRYITFLFVSDCWVAGGSLPELFRLVREQDAAIGLSPFTIADESGTARRTSQRFHLPGRTSAVTSPREFLSVLLESGLFPLGPLQANIYRISPDHKLRFDETLPTRTDVSATFDFIHEAAQPVVIVAAPFLQWREHGGRFHASMGAGQTVCDYLDMFESACERTRMPMDYRRAKTRVMLNSLRLIAQDAPPAAWSGLLRTLLRHSSRSPHRGSVLYAVEALWLRFVRGRRLLEFAD
jgi:hypothetical protein